MFRSRVVLPLGLSLALHGAVGVWVKVRGAEVETRSEVTRPDVWSGRGIEIEPASVETGPASEPVTAPRESTPSETNEPVAVEPACVANCAPRVTTPSTDVTEAAAAPKPKPPASTSTRVRPAASIATPSASSAASVTSSGSSASAASSGAPVAGGDAFGTLGLPQGVRYLPLAYVRAISQGGWGVSGFRNAPTGRLCAAHLSVAVNGDRTIGPVEYGGERERDLVPTLCRTLFENARRLIVNGEFSLDPKSLTDGVMRLHVTVEVTDGEPRAESENAPHGLWSESHEPANPGRRGRSTFMLNSGRRVDAWVELE